MVTLIGSAPLTCENRGRQAFAQLAAATYPFRWLVACPCGSPAPVQSLSTPISVVSCGVRPDLAKSITLQMRKSKAIVVLVRTSRLHLILLH